jgi:hypothetical protein
MVSVLPLTVAGPEITLKVTGSPELAVAYSMIGPTPKVTGVAGAVNVMVWLVCSTLKALLVAMILIGAVRGGVVVNGSVATSASPVPSALTCNVLEPAIPDALVLSEVTLSEPGSPAASAMGMATPLTENGLPLSLSCRAAAKFALGGTLAGGSVLKLSA